MPVPRTARRRTALAALLLAAGTALGGCAVAQRPSSAAFVGGQAISDATLAEATQQINDNLIQQGGTALTEAQVLQTLVIAPTVLKQVQASGSWKPDARYNALIARVPDVSQATKDFVATYVVTAQGGPLTADDGQAILAQLQKADIQIDPRYGVFNPADGGILTPTPNWIKTSGQ